MSPRVIVITGSRKGIGRYLTEQYLECGDLVIGCSRKGSDLKHDNYEHYELDVADETAVCAMIRDIVAKHDRIDVLLNNAGIASMNHALLTPKRTIDRVLDTNVIGTFLFCREAAKPMCRQRSGRIVNFSTVAVALRLQGEAVYAASKAAVEALTRVMARELGEMGVTINALGPTPVDTDLIRAVPADKITALQASQAIQRLGTFEDVKNVVDFFIAPESDFVTGQVVYLGGVG